MKLSYDWLHTYIDTGLDADALATLLTELGLEVEGQETYESIAGGLEGVVVGRVLTCERHPDADRLSVTTVDIGADEALPIVCGAPNVAAGQFVAVATIGTTLYHQGEPWIIKKSKIRGQQSHGMICAEDELGLGDRHDGIMVLDGELTPGMPLSDLFEVTRDVVYEIGLTPNRSDATSHIGVAKDLSAALAIRMNEKRGVRIPEISQEFDLESSDFHVEVRATDACPRYSGVLLEGLEVGPAPEWIQHRLQAIGVKSINNVVDITNFVLHEFGQPLHAFDLNRIAGGGIIVDRLPADTPFVALDGESYKLYAEDLMICDGNGHPMCLAGVYGGLHSGVSDSTTAIFLESAHFSADSIRRSSMRHNLRTDAAKIYEKGSDPSITVRALWRAVNLLQEYAGAKVRSPLFDLYPSQVPMLEIEVNLERINRWIGHSFSPAELESIFSALNFQTKDKPDPQSWIIAIPADKHDVRREADVIEEILRIYGYDRVDPSHKMAFNLSLSEDFDRYAWRHLMIDRLTGMGYDQMMNMSMTRSSYYPDVPDLVQVLNTSNRHLDTMRRDMIMSALECVGLNLRHGNRRLRLFEIGRQYRTRQDDFIEEERLACAISGQSSDVQWEYKPMEASVFELKGVVSGLLPQTVIAQSTWQFEAESGQLIFKNHPLAKITTCSRALCEQFDIDQSVYVLEIDAELSYHLWREHRQEFQAWSKYPSVARDIALVVDKRISWDDISNKIKETSGRRLRSFHVFDIYENEQQVGAGKKSMAIRCYFEDMDKTLTDKDVDQIISRITSTLKTTFDATLR